ncbi:flagellin N-terminal helical domain-containing protein [Paracoccus denitrificans]|jgi:flagellar hook-associated protein 3 FlgL|uniref:Flagellin n=1 Tax=Paracoccus denitrificans (strain Pd 1222) TaxID=318586 RepID=A1B5J1_PARDP|nr:flagellin [Paracoccus denitrificans]ABL70785.1 putative flagellar hook-associated protein [Paracoccus denitrificans PD1222]MBB4628957.1 flagellar hook-associated protein 3 FlgL [Paracoccus denitrificans]MCU7429922.1 flagellin [Paracoccus denitrificans]QAR26107.1 flagellar hook protein [Paracoccus denitrificans]UPV95022.1 flagellar hook protein [Paracoccus denitrificans]
MTSFHSIGDLSRSYQLRLGQNGLRTKLDRLTQEMISGVKSDIPKALGGDLAGISHIESRLQLLTTFQQNASEAQNRLTTMQAALEQVYGVVDDLGPRLLSEPNISGEHDLRARADSTKQDFRSMFSVLNTSIGGQYLFAGSRTDSAPLGSFDVMLAELTSTVAGVTTAADIADRIDAWFDAPAGMGGFADRIYQGDDNGSTRFSISPDRQIDKSLTANSTALRDTLKGMAIIAYASEAGAAIDTATLRDLFSEAGTRLLKGAAGLISAQADLGRQQAIVTQAQTRNSAETAALSIARTNLIGADPFETVTTLEETEAKIQSLYAITARLSRLNLTDYLS